MNSRFLFSLQDECVVARRPDLVDKIPTRNAAPQPGFRVTRYYRSDRHAFWRG